MEEYNWPEMENGYNRPTFPRFQFGPFTTALGRYMSEETESAARQELQLREWAELSNLCRTYETLSRTSLSIFVAFATAVTAFLLKEDLSQPATVTLDVIALLFGLFTLNVLIRVRDLYTMYVKRAKKIENALGIEVYRLWDEGMRSHLTIRNKLAIQLFAWAFVAYFFGRTVLDVYIWYQGAA